MKALPQLLGCLLVVSVSLPNSGVAWSDTPSKKSQIKSSSKAQVKRARLAVGEAKRLVKAEAPVKVEPPVVAIAPAAASEPVAAKTSPEPRGVAVTTSSPANPRVVASTPPSAAPASKSEAFAVKVNSYLPGAAATVTLNSTNPYLPTAATPAAATPPSPTKSSAAAAPTVVAVKVDAAPSAPAPAPALIAPVVVKAAPEAAKQPLVVTAGEQAWAKIVAGPVAAAAPAAARSAANPYLTYRTAYNPGIPTASLASLTASPASPTASPAADPSQLFNSLRDFLPDLHLPSADIDVLPSITKVYPTGERPMYVLTFKCPTELVGITPPPTKALRWLITSGMEAINSTNLLPFSMQQVCQ